MADDGAFHVEWAFVYEPSPEVHHVPLPGWTCESYRYEVKWPGEEHYSDDASIYLATSADGSKTSINFWMFDPSGWHGYFKGDESVKQMYLKFNCRGRGNPLHGCLLFQTSETVWLGVDYNKRSIRMTLGAKWVVNEDGMWVPAN